MTLESRCPTGPIETRWTRHKGALKLIGPINRKKYDVIVIGSGLAGASAAATLAEQGYKVKVFCFHDSPRRAHSVAAQGGINAAKNYQNDGDSVFRLFYDTVKGGDFRARESNVHRLAEVSANIIDQAVAQGVPFAREYGGTLANRTFGGVLVSRTFYARGQTGQQLLLGAYASLMRQVDLGKVTLFPYRDMLELVIEGGAARGIVCRDLLTGKLEVHTGHTVLMCTGGYSNVFYLSTNAMKSNVTATWRAHRQGAFFANPCYTQIHPTCIPEHGDWQSKLTLMSESLRNSGRVWVPKKAGDNRPPNQIPDDERDYYLERRYPTFGNMVPRDVASRNAKYVCDEGRGVGATGRAVYLDFRDAIRNEGRASVEGRYGNLFDMYANITGEDPYEVPMRIYPAPHYTMGGLWVDYNLMSNLPGLFVLGEANFSDHGSNRLGASALMQGLADGYFIAPYTVPDYLATAKPAPLSPDAPVCKEAVARVKQRIDGMMAIGGKRSPDSFHRDLGLLMLDKVGMSRTAEGLRETIERVRGMRKEFWEDLRIVGSAESANAELEKALRIADFMEFAELMARDALAREESCGGHFREEYQTEDGEALRVDATQQHVSAWEFTGTDSEPVLHKEPLEFEYVKPSTRSYK
ncbi:MAG: fumarate reductase/succinate dehydrogenase flavoprotein subunit [Deltaproteobacteria bacterium]|nr:fumarate reductase/succinate dehydrogenase flavoprotein subunit [Deltaproteobacteria bacterium]MCB9786712.1 fumarate reductase/succinate dehydrogenase flavoprotein subunit [Deltaproteobacteria bacterium]